MKAAIALLAVFVVAANAAITPLEEVQESRGNHDTAILIHKISKEVKELVQMFEQCQSYESDALKGTCFTKFSLQLAADIKALAEAIHKMNKAREDQEWELGELAQNTILDIRTLIDIVHECERNWRRPGACWTRFAIEVIKALINLIEGIANNNRDVGEFQQVVAQLAATL